MHSPVPFFTINHPDYVATLTSYCMNDLSGLYHEEEKALDEFRVKIKRDRITRTDLVEFVNRYNDMLIQSKVITKVSDRFQAKLNKANETIIEQNEEIIEKNHLLEKTIAQLVKAKMGKKASTVIFTVAVVLFLSEEVFIGEIIALFINIQYLDLLLKGGIAFGLKFLEGGLETFYMKKEQLNILKKGKSEKLQVQSEVLIPSGFKMGRFANKVQ